MNTLVGHRRPGSKKLVGGFSSLVKALDFAAMRRVLGLGFRGSCVGVSPFLWV